MHTALLLCYMMGIAGISFPLIVVVASLLAYESGVERERRIMAMYRLGTYLMVVSLVIKLVLIPFVS